MEEEEGGWLPVAAWLAALHLEQYADAFERSELRTVWDCRALTDEGLTRLGVLLPGHRKRILLGVQKAFAEAALPEPPPRKPVPMKRHIFRQGAGTAAPTEPPRCPPLLEPEGAASVALLPPPIPPRVGCRPPVKFSPAASSPEPPPPCSPAPELPPLPAPKAESRARPPLPPLPAKRHQVEGKCQSLKAPPAPSRPPALPPRAGSQHEASRYGAGSGERRVSGGEAGPGGPRAVGSP